MTTNHLRRVAANEVIVGDELLRQAVVEISNGRVVGYHTFTDEQPFTEWLPGTIHITDTDGIPTATWNGKRL